MKTKEMNVHKSTPVNVQKHQKINKQKKKGKKTEYGALKDQQYHMASLLLVFHNLNAAVKALKVLHSSFLDLNRTD